MTMRPENTRLEYGKLKVVGGNNHSGGPSEVGFVFNPAKLTLVAQAKWEQPSQSGARQSSQPNYKGPEPRSLDVEFILDGWDKSGAGRSDTRDIARDIETLVSWTRPTESTRSTRRPMPPFVCLEWGRPWFTAYVASVNSSITVFDAQGTPLRATVKVTLKEVPEERSGQNPTSGSLVGHQSHTLVAGESLPGIAQRYYRKPAYWRGIAKANGIDDPSRLTVGRRLYLPPIEQVSETSR